MVFDFLAKKKYIHKNSNFTSLVDLSAAGVYDLLNLADLDFPTDFVFFPLFIYIVRNMLTLNSKYNSKIL